MNKIKFFFNNNLLFIFVILFTLINHKIFLTGFYQDEFHSILRTLNQQNDIGLLNLIKFNLFFLPINEIVYLLIQYLFKGNFLLFNFLNYILILTNIYLFYCFIKFFTKDKILIFISLSLVFFNKLSLQGIGWNWASISYQLGMMIALTGLLIFMNKSNNKLLISFIIITLAGFVRPFFVFTFPLLILYLFFNKKYYNLLIIILLQFIIIYINFFFQIKEIPNFISFDVSQTENPRLYIGYSKYLFVRPFVHIGQSLLFFDYQYNLKAYSFCILSIIFIFFLFKSFRKKRNELLYALSALFLLFNYFTIYNFDYFAKETIFLESRHYYVSSFIISFIIVLLLDHIRKLLVLNLLCKIGLIIMILVSVSNIIPKNKYYYLDIQGRYELVNQISSNFIKDKINILLIEEINSQVQYNRISYSIQTGFTYPLILKNIALKNIKLKNSYHKIGWNPGFEGIIDTTKKIGIFFDLKKMNTVINEKNIDINKINIIKLIVDYNNLYLNPKKIPDIKNVITTISKL